MDFPLSQWFAYCFLTYVPVFLLFFVAPFEQWTLLRVVARGVRQPHSAPHLKPESQSAPHFCACGLSDKRQSCLCLYRHRPLHSKRHCLVSGGGGGEGTITRRFPNFLRRLDMELLLCICWPDKVVSLVHGCVLQLHLRHSTLRSITQNT